MPRRSATAWPRPVGASASWARASTTGRRRARAARTTSGSRSSCRRSRSRTSSVLAACACRSGRRAARCSSACCRSCTRPGSRCSRRSRVRRRPARPRPAPRSIRSWASTTRTCACSWTSRCSCPPSPRATSSACRRGGVPAELIDALRHRWRDPATVGAIVDLLRSGGVPASVHTLYMDMLVRFGRSDATVIADVLPWIGAFHLKFWDLEDSDDRVSGPIRDLAALLAGTRLQRHALQRVGRARVARRRPHRP